MGKKMNGIRASVVGAVTVFSLSAAAQTQVNLYGQADMFVGTSKAIGGERAYILGSGGMQTSYWGMKGSEELGSGVKAIFDLGGFYRGDTGRFGRTDADGFFTRSAFVGVDSSRIGTIRLGRNTTPYFLSTILFNPLVDSFNFSPTIFQTYKSVGSGALFDPGIIGDSGWNNSVVYSMPVMGGLSANAIYSFGEQPGATGQNKWGGNVSYLSGPIGATIAFQQVKFNLVPGDVSAPPNLVGFTKQSAAQAGLSYDFTLVKLFAQAQYIKTDVGGPGGDIKHLNGQIGASVPIGSGSLLASYSYAKVKSNISDFHRNTAALAYDYNFSKRTDVYAALFFDKLADQSHADTVGIGIRHRF
ncbi:porin [Cupriavidus sp. 8B]